MSTWSEAYDHDGPVGPLRVEAAHDINGVRKVTYIDIRDARTGSRIDSLKLNGHLDMGVIDDLVTSRIEQVAS